MVNYKDRSVALAVLSYVGVSLSNVHAAQAQQHSMSKEEQKSIEKSLEGTLLDPFSAQYVWPKVPIENNFSDGAVGYCFKVNAKNRMGAYTGFHLVYGRAIRPKNKITGFQYRQGLDPIGGNEALDQSGVAGICQALGIDIDD
jgi:hypothetical protein